MNRKNLTAAVLAGLAGAAGIVGSAQAVNVNPDGLGQVLLYPYYTTNGGNQTILSVVNTSDYAKAVKVRFLEGQNSREVLDFNLYMSAYDVWTAALAKNAEGVPTMYTDDTTCTVPYIYGDFDGEQAFLPWRLNDEDPEGFADVSVRGSEGHFEMIEMGTMIDELEPAKDASGNLTGKLTPSYGSAAAATHTDAGVPANCAQLNIAWTRSSGADGDGYWIPDGELSNGSEPLRDMAPPSGGLFGGAAIINVAAGAMYSYDAKALNGFANSVTNTDDPERSDELHAEPGSILPSLDSGGVFRATVFSDKGQTVDVALLRRGVDAVSYVLMHDQIMNEYTTEAIVNAGTEWVVTFPTKQFYVHRAFLDDIADFRDTIPFYDPIRDLSGNVIGMNPIDPFTSTWTWVAAVEDASGNVTKEAYVDFPCEAVVLDSIWDREEQDPADAPAGPDQPPIVSPRPPAERPDGLKTFSFCYETQVVRFGPEEGKPDSTEILGSANYTNIDNDSLGFEFGWLRLDLTDASADFDQDGDIETLLRRPLPDRFSLVIDELDWENGLMGLPTIGFAVQRFVNKNAGEGLNANYGGIFQHKGTRQISNGGFSD
jgi:hypothetical protein